MAVKMTALTSQGFSEGTQIECPGVVVGGGMLEDSCRLEKIAISLVV